MPDQIPDTMFEYMSKHKINKLICKMLPNPVNKHMHKPLGD